MQNDNGYDDTSEEGKLLACVQDESVTYASTRDLEPPATCSIYERFVVTSENHMMSPMAPVTVQVHSEHHVSSFFLVFIISSYFLTIKTFLYLNQTLHSLSINFSSFQIPTDIDAPFLTTS
jgi:hypothetical protein